VCLLQTLITVKLGCKVSAQADIATVMLTSTDAANIGLPQGKKGASASAEGLADQLVAEEAQAAAKAASKKAKKQKAKARKLQGRSDAVAAALPEAPAQAIEAEDEQLGDNVAAAPAVGEPMLEGDSAAAAMAKQDAAAHAKPVHAESNKEQQPDQASSHNADNKFLRDLFCCPLTKVSNQHKHTYH
jgi:NADH dehydrogenase/NADH:ubiquinone oxidoreductase subunit G